MEEKVTNGILSSAVRASVTKLAEKGIDGCTTKDVILASFGCLSLNGGLCSSNEVKAMTNEVKKFGWKIAGMCFSTLIAIVMVLIFL
uniref:Uncharacterized protein n=1 Tax=viral metagenome TaxID=1070528 RepID=A0A6M3L957_9ZZZZ